MRILGQDTRCLANHPRCMATLATKAAVDWQGSGVTGKVPRSLWRIDIGLAEGFQELPGSRREEKEKRPIQDGPLYIKGWMTGVDYPISTTPTVMLLR
jgi:hypothetical protein